jgi:polyisoprenoid-binding protein YceI
MSVIEQQAGSITGTWDLDATHSTVGFEVKHMGVATFRGQIPDVAATLEAADDVLRVNGVARIESLKTQDENLDAHLRSPDFFDAERYPALHVVATGARGEGDEVVFDGELTIRDITRPIELRGTVSGPVTDFVERERLGLELETKLDRTEFGLDWNAPLPGGGVALANDVKLVAHLEFVKQADASLATPTVSR